jgi:ABC-type multidrug transport system ATPase subunit
MNKSDLKTPLVGSSREHVAIPVVTAHSQQGQDGKSFGNEATTNMDRIVPITLKVKRLNYYLGNGKHEKRILKDVNLHFKSGMLTELMGPSGAGKTTLLNLLIGNAGGRIEGSVEVNGRALKKVANVFKKFYTFVPQDDSLLASLSTRETLMFAARLRLPMTMPMAEKKRRVNRVLAELSLIRCADQRIGDVDRRGISGGERKRASIALELLVNPSVIFIDEPTSGLDSKMAEDVVRTLRRLAEQGRSLICTIHQPSYKIFRLFDRLVLLSLGRVVYEGKIDDVEGYFSTIGYETPRGENPIDFYMAVMQLAPGEEPMGGGRPGGDLPTLWLEHGGDFVEEEEGGREGGLTWFPNSASSNSLGGMMSRTGSVQSLASAEGGGEGGGEGGRKGMPMASSQAGMDLKTLAKDVATGVPKWYQCWVLFHRAFVDSLKDTDKFLGGLILKGSIGLLVGVVWLRQGESAEQKSIFPLTGALFIATTSSVLDTLFACILTFPSMKTLLLREYKNGSYSLLPFYVATLANAILFNGGYAIFLGTPIYFLVGDVSNARLLGQPFDAARYFLFLALLAVLATIGAALGLAVGALVKDIQQGQQAVMPTVIPLLLFSGYLIPFKQSKYTQSVRTLSKCYPERGVWPHPVRELSNESLEACLVLLNGMLTLIHAQYLSVPSLRLPLAVPPSVSFRVTNGDLCSRAHFLSPSPPP